MTPPDTGNEPEAAGPASEREAAWRLWSDWRRAEAQRLENQEDALFREMEVLTAAGRLQLALWDREFQTTENGKLPSPAVRIRRREEIIAREYETHCSDGRARWLAARRAIEHDPVLRLIREARSLQGTISQLTEQGSAEVNKLADLIGGHGESLRQAFAEADLADVRQKISSLDEALQSLDRRLAGSTDKTWLGWKPPRLVSWLTESLASWIAESGKVLGGILGAALILWLLQMAGSPPALKFYNQVIGGITSTLQHETTKVNGKTEDSHE